MADPSLYTYAWPLAGWESETALSEERSEDGKSLRNPAATKLSATYESFVPQLDHGSRGAFDVHIYYMQAIEEQKAFAKALHERIRREFPELRIYKFFEVPVGPHPIAMFEVNLFTPAQFGAFIPWLVINRGPLSALIHPNTVDPVTGEVEDEERDHTQRATWMGERWPLDLSMFKKRAALKQAESAAKATTA